MKNWPTHCGPVRDSYFEDRKYSYFENRAVRNLYEAEHTVILKKRRWKKVEIDFQVKCFDPDMQGYCGVSG